MANYYYEVALNIPLNKLYFYTYPKELKIGIRVVVNFNGSDKFGIIIKKHKENELSENFSFKVKEILQVIDNKTILNEHNINLAYWLTRKTFSSFGECLFYGIPKNIKSIKQKNSKKIDIEKINENIPSIELNEEQETAYVKIIDSKKMIFYLFGITGSGKTEIFIKLCMHYLEQKKQILFLIPEISLGHQIIRRLKEKLNTSEIYEYNSKVSNLKKETIWNKVKNEDSLVILGVKSVLILPFTNLGLIIMDEEHESTYKSEQTPRFHSRHLAFYLQKTFNAKFVMGSATPSLEAYLSMQNGQIEKIELKNKFFQKKIKEIKIIDMKKEPNIISSELLYSIQKSIHEKRQALLFLNKRGYSKNLECNTCGYIICCPNCSFNLTYHSKESKLLCHYCNYKTEVIKTCSKCDSTDIRYKTYGIQFIEKELKKFLPNAKIARADSDLNKKEIIKAINSFENGEIDILIGTQIIAKGFNFKNIKTLGIINADIGMGLPDFRSGERLFALITQVIGRSARFYDDNTVIIQTKNPSYYAIKYAYEGEVEEFYNEEIKIRKELNYPPFNKIIRVLFRSKKEETSKNKAFEFFELSKEFLKNEISYLGPSEAPMQKISQNYRYNIIYISKSWGELENLIRKTKEKFTLSNDFYIEVDYYPISLI